MELAIRPEWGERKKVKEEEEERSTFPDCLSPPQCRAGTAIIMNASSSCILHPIAPPEGGGGDDGRSHLSSAAQSFTLTLSTPSSEEEVFPTKCAAILESNEIAG